MNELRCTKYTNTGEIIKVKKKKAVVLKSMSSYVGCTCFLIFWTPLWSFVPHHSGSQTWTHTQTHTLALTLGFCRSLTILVQLSAALSLHFQTLSGFDQQWLPLFHLRPFHCWNVTTTLTISRHYDNLCARHPVWTRLCATFECKMKMGR